MDNRSLLRFLTCGSVDDGKSTLIGRLLFETGSIFDDQLQQLAIDSERFGTTGKNLDFALLLDGLESERQQGITIDVAYRFFSTTRRGFIVADAPGHEQYTRNMATGASTAMLAVVLVDARKGVIVQTRRHSYICSLLGIRHLILAVNKMDLIDYSQSRFDEITTEFKEFSAALGFGSVTAIPLCARDGDNITRLSVKLPWYAGPPLLQHLETVDVNEKTARGSFRMPVQWINRPDSDFRGFSGTLCGGQVEVGDAVVVSSSKRLTRISKIVTFDGELKAAYAGDAVTLVLEDDVDVSRGDVFSHPETSIDSADQLAATILWLHDEAMLPGRTYVLKLGTSTTLAKITSVRHLIDVNTLTERPARPLVLNDVARCHLSCDAPIAMEPYSDNKTTGGFILIDRSTNSTVGAGMVVYPLRRSKTIVPIRHTVIREDRAALKGHGGAVVWLTGLSGSGKSTIANMLERTLHARGVHTYLLDGDNLRTGLNRDLGFRDEDRVENIRRAGEVAKLFVDASLIIICSFISPFRAERETVRELFANGEFVEVFVDAPLDVCEKRDPKGLYSLARKGQIKHFTGLNSPYEPPEAPEVHLGTAAASPEECVASIMLSLSSILGSGPEP